MKILWFTWKDRKHPQAGGAEVVNEELAKRLVRDGHEVIFVVGGFPGGLDEETVDGYRIIRLGNRYTVYWKAYRYYKKHLQGWADLVIDEMNTLPFFCKYYVDEPVIFFPHQLCRRVWFYQMSLPISLIGYIAEPFYLRLINDYQVVTVSESSKRDLMRYGFQSENIHIISEGLELEPIENLDGVKKYKRPTVLSLGSVRGMKRTAHQLRAFELAKRTMPDLQMKIAGDMGGSYGNRVQAMIERSLYRKDIECFGRVNKAKKSELMQKSHCILVTSVKEGWGLIVTEANSQGTPAVGYDVDGLRDSIRDGDTGILTEKNNPDGLAVAIIRLFRDDRKYATIRERAWLWSQEFSFEKSYQEFLRVVGAAVRK